MNVLLILIFASLGIAASFLGAFIWAVKSGQFEDTCTPSLRMLPDEPAPKTISEPITTPNGQIP